MKIGFINCKINIRENLAGIRKRVFQRPVCHAVAIDSVSDNINGIAEDMFVLNSNPHISHGVIITKNANGNLNYSLAQEKLTPFIYDFLLHNPKEKFSNIKNLTNELKKFLYNGVTIDEIFKNNPNLNRTVGSLPQKWGKKVGSSKEKREKIDNLFTEFGREFHSKVQNENSTVVIETQNLQQELSQVLSSDVTIAELSKGSWGQTYKISVDGQDYVLKVYYNRSPIGYGTGKYYHGNYNELSSAAWVSKNDADKYTMFYMGRFGENNDGYLLTRYLPDETIYGKIYNDMLDIDDKNFVFSRYLHKSFCGDLHLSNNKNNRHGKKIIDFGHIYLSEAGKLGESTYYLTKTLGRLLDENNIKELEKIIAKKQGTEEFRQAQSFLRYLINEHTTIDNIEILKSKKQILSKLGLDYVPDIRYILSKMKFPVLTKYVNRTESMTKIYSQILEIPQKAFEELWYKYPKLIFHSQQ